MFSWRPCKFWPSFVYLFGNTIFFCRLSTLDSLWNGDLICARGERACRSTGALWLCGALLSIQRRDALLSREVDWVSPLRIILVLLILCLYWQLPQPQVKLLFLLVFFLLVVPSRAWDDDVGQAGSDHAAVVPEIFSELQQRIEQVKWCWKHQLWTFGMLSKQFPDARLISPRGITVHNNTNMMNLFSKETTSILNPHGLLKPVPGVAVFVRHKENTSFPTCADSAHNLKRQCSNTCYCQISCANSLAKVTDQNMEGETANMGWERWENCNYGYLTRSNATMCNCLKKLNCKNKCYGMNVTKMQRWQTCLWFSIPTLAPFTWKFWNLSSGNWSLT